MSEPPVATASPTPDGDLPPRRNRIIPGPADMRTLTLMATAIAESSFAPKGVGRDPKKAFVILLAGWEWGMGAMEALRSIEIIDGKTCLHADAMAAKILQRGGKLEFPVLNHEECTVRATRPGHEPLTLTWTTQDATRADLANRNNWRKYPRAMLRSRAIAEVARTLFPDALAGCYTMEELGADEVEPDGSQPLLENLKSPSQSLPTAGWIRKAHPEAETTQVTADESGDQTGTPSADSGETGTVPAKSPTITCREAAAAVVSAFVDYKGWDQVTYEKALSEAAGRVCGSLGEIPDDELVRSLRALVDHDTPPWGGMDKLLGLDASVLAAAGLDSCVTGDAAESQPAAARRRSPPPPQRPKMKMPKSLRERVSAQIARLGADRCTDILGMPPEWIREESELQRLVDTPDP